MMTLEKKNEMHLLSFKTLFNIKTLLSSHFSLVWLWVMVKKSNLKLQNLHPSSCLVQNALFVFSSHAAQSHTAYLRIFQTVPHLVMLWIVQSKLNSKNSDLPKCIPFHFVFHKFIVMYSCKKCQLKKGHLWLESKESDSPLILLLSQSVNVCYQLSLIHDCKSLNM